MKATTPLFVAALVVLFQGSQAQDTVLRREADEIVDSDPIHEAAPAQPVSQSQNYENELLREEMNRQGKNWPNDCTVAWRSSKCWVKGDCPALNTDRTAWWYGCAMGLKSISMGRHRDGGCWIECSEWTENTAMAHNCIWQQKNGNWQVWGSPSDSKTWCPGCSL